MTNLERFEIGLKIKQRAWRIKIRAKILATEIKLKALKLMLRKAG